MVRLAILVQGQFNLVTLDDPTFNIGFVTSGIECNLAIITASAPALRPLLRARERGGWFPRSTVSPSKASDPETGKRSTEWESDPLASATSRGGKPGRSGSRGGRRGGGKVRSGRGGKKPIIRLRSDVAELRSQSPRPSEEESMTNDGIMRVSDIQREIDGIVKEIAMTGSGSYTGIPRIRRPDPAPAPPAPVAKDAISWPIASTGDAPPQLPPWRSYTESVYSYDMRERDYNEERISKYGDRRNALYTPRGQAPSRGPTRSNSASTRGGASTWKESPGRPF